MVGHGFNYSHITSVILRILRLIFSMASIGEDQKWWPVAAHEDLTIFVPMDSCLWILLASFALIILSELYLDFVTWFVNHTRSSLQYNAYKFRKKAIFLKFDLDFRIYDSYSIICSDGSLKLWVMATFRCIFCLFLECRNCYLIP